MLEVSWEQLVPRTKEECVEYYLAHPGYKGIIQTMIMNDAGHHSGKSKFIFNVQMFYLAYCVCPSGLKTTIEKLHEIGYNW